MNNQARSIRPFIGAKNFEESRSFYRELGFEEVVLLPAMSLFKTGQLAFYLQDAYLKDWIENTMLFLEVENVDRFWQELTVLQLEDKYRGVKLNPVRMEHWGKECFVHDPAGNLWHIGQFD